MIRPPETMATVGMQSPSRAVVLDPWAVEALIRERKRTGAHRWDEVWEGVLHVVPGPNADHQCLVWELETILRQVVRPPGGGSVVHEMNTADPARGFSDYRIPDIVVLLRGSKASLKGALVRGGPDFAVEVRSPGDETYEKIPFYARIGVRELLVVEPERKTVELFRHDGRGLKKIGGSLRPAESEVVGLRFETVERDGRPAILVTARDGRSWEILSLPESPDQA